jgi:hypothetical protein
LPHAILDINARGDYRGLVSSAKWAPAGPSSVRSFGNGIPQASSIRMLSARLGSILEISLEGLLMRSISLFAAPIDAFVGQISTSKPFQRVRYTSVRVRSGQEVSFYAPGAGEWIMYAVIGFPDGSGSGTYFWRIKVK